MTDPNKLHQRVCDLEEELRKETLKMLTAETGREFHRVKMVKIMRMLYQLTGNNAYKPA